MITHKALVLSHIGCEVQKRNRVVHELQKAILDVSHCFHNSVASDTMNLVRVYVLPSANSGALCSKSSFPISAYIAFPCISTKHGQDDMVSCMRVHESLPCYWLEPYLHVAPDQCRCHRGIPRGGRHERRHSSSSLRVSVPTEHGRPSETPRILYRNDK